MRWQTPQIFLADLPDLDTAVTYAINGIFGNMGEVCNAGSRLLLDNPLPRILARFIERGKDAYRAGDPLDPITNWAVGDRFAPRPRHELHHAGQAEALDWSSAAAHGSAGAFVNPTLFSASTIA